MPTSDVVAHEALRFLRDNATAVVATVQDGKPYAATVYFFVDDDFNFYFLSKRNTSKYVNISFNSNVAIVVGTGPEHITVQARGQGDIVVDEEQDAVYEKIKELRAREHVKSWPLEEIDKFKNRQFVAFKVVPTELFLMNLDDKKYPESVSDHYNQII
jgi:uncharacterized pyridoxamine 5'-phosphate oxidase family protein